LDASRLDGLDAVVHLAGESIAGRWTASKRRAIRDSRVKGTAMLAEVVSLLPKGPSVFVSASAVGFYGSRGDESLDESSAPGAGFLPDTCREWEEAAAPARSKGLRTVHLRTGIVLTPEGGALGRMLLPFRMGLGGVVGTGDQWMSWISLTDEVAAIRHVLQTPSLAGPVNLTAPDPVTNRDFTRTLGRVLRRPTVFPLPGFVVKAVFGEMGERLLLEGQRVLPRRLRESGFRFAHPDLETALRSELGR
jgi:uncharacterized protein (TIGR01777 family)